MKICDFGLARDIYKDPDYVRKGDVSYHKTVRWSLACSKKFPLINGKKNKRDSGKATQFCLFSCALRTEFGVAESKLSDFLQMLGNSQGWC